MIRRAPFFPGWVIVAGCFVTLMVSAGLGFYAASVILSAATEELDASIATVSFGPTLFFGISGITGFVVSKRMDLIDIRWFYLAGGIVGAVALFGLRYVDTVFGYYLFFAVFGVAFSVAGLVPSTTIVARWFSARRSVALSISSTGMSVGGIVLTPAVARLIDAEGLAGSSTKMSLGWFFGIVPIAMLILRSSPESLGLRPDGAPAPVVGGDSPAGGSAERPPGAPFAVARWSRFFVLLSASYALVFLAQVGALAHMFNLAKDRSGLDTATVVLSVLAFTSVVGRLAAGFAVLRISSKRLAAGLIVVQSVAMVAFALSRSGGAVLASAGLFGVTVGSLLMLQPLLIAEAFGTREYSRIYSLSQLAATAGVAGGPFIVGFIRDTASYEAAYLAASVVVLVGLGLLVAAGPVAEVHSLWEQD